MSGCLGGCQLALRRHSKAHCQYLIECLNRIGTHVERINVHCTDSTNELIKELRDIFDEPGQSVLIGGLVANRDVYFNANLGREAGQGASFSIQKCSLADNGTPLPTLRLLPVSSWRSEARVDTCSS